MVPLYHNDAVGGPAETFITNVNSLSIHPLENFPVRAIPISEITYFDVCDGSAAINGGQKVPTENTHTNTHTHTQQHGIA